MALVYGQHSGGSVGHRERDHLHMNDGQLYQYQSSSRASGAGGVSHCRVTATVQAVLGAFS